MMPFILYAWEWADSFWSHCSSVKLTDRTANFRGSSGDVFLPMVLLREPRHPFSPTKVAQWRRTISSIFQWCSRYCVFFHAYRASLFQQHWTEKKKKVIFRKSILYMFFFGFIIKDAILAFCLWAKMGLWSRGPTSPTTSCNSFDYWFLLTRGV